MLKAKYYYNTKFPVSVMREVHNLFLSFLDKKEKIPKVTKLKITFNDEEWEYDNLEEFFAEYHKANYFLLDHIVQGNRLFLSQSSKNNFYAAIEFADRENIQAIFEVFERNCDNSKITIDSDPIKIFIGHGHNSQWRDLKDHLHDHHGFDVVAYEIGPRAGLSVKEVLEEMLNNSSFALLVLTGEDLHTDGELHARENVIHELGLFQGRLGFQRAIALLEEGVKEFSNILGINQIRFSKNNIREVFGDVLATIKREIENQNKQKNAVGS